MNLFFRETEGEEIRRLFNFKKKEPIIKKGTYAYMLGLNKPLKFLSPTDKVANQAEFDNCVNYAEHNLKSDLERLGKRFYAIDPALINMLDGTIGSMLLLGDDEGNISYKFHKRKNKLWDGEKKKYPEICKTGKYRYEIFFILDDDEDEEE